MTGRPTLEDVLERMRGYCAIQERAHSEVRAKLLKLRIFGDDLEEIMSQLISEDFLNEERYARAYARGKFRMNKWGKVKIRMHLQQHGVSERNVSRGLSEIDEEEYVQMIDDELTKRLRGASDNVAKRKAQDFMYRRGFEPELVVARLSAVSSD